MIEVNDNSRKTYDFTNLGFHFIKTCKQKKKREMVNFLVICRISLYSSDTFFLVKGFFNELYSYPATNENR